jgi:hypothetical protein
MEPFEKDELTESELDRLLAGWTAPEAPARLRASIFLESSAPWWKRLWLSSVRIPVPVVCALLLAIATAVWIGAKPRAPQIVVKTERVEVPVVQERVVTKFVTKYVHQQEPSSFDIHGLKPVAELRPRIIRSGDAKN